MCTLTSKVVCRGCSTVLGCNKNHEVHKIATELGWVVMAVEEGIYLCPKCVSKHPCYRRIAAQTTTR